MLKKLTIQGAILTLAAICVMLALPGSALADKCGNGICRGNETPDSCPADCTVVPPPSGGGGVDIPLCVTLASNTPGISGNDPDNDVVQEQTFCDGEVHEQARINRTAGVLEVSLFSQATPRIRLDFSDCVQVAGGMGGPTDDPNCAARANDFPVVVTGDPDPLMVGFDSKEEVGGTGEALDFTGLGNDPTLVALVVRFGFNENIQQIRRRINYGPIVNGLNVDGDLEGCTSDPVTVTRLTDGCWEVKSTPSQEACLSKGTGRGNNASIELQGRYNMPFLMTLKEIIGTDDITGDPIPASCD